MNFLNLVVVKISICFAFGIISAFFFPVSHVVYLKYLIPCFVLLLGIWLWEYNKLQLGIFFGITVYLSFFLLGYSNYQLRSPNLQPNHYANYIEESADNDFQNTKELIYLEILEVLKPNNFGRKYIAEVFQLQSKQVTGRILLTIKKDSTPYIHKIGDSVLVVANINSIPQPLNPHQFNYKQYLTHLEIYHQIYISKKHILKHNNGAISLKSLAQSIRNYCIEQLRKTRIEENQRVIIQALVLGEKKELSQELRSKYAAAGALHILAISGLHVGILFLIFSKLLHPLTYFRAGKYIKTIVLVCILWGFALIAGLSPSVVRAVTMFSFFAFAEILNRPTSSFNSLFLSFFILLILQPHWLFHVGFQLSYLAVFAILWLQPKLYAIYRPKYRLDRLFWGIITVTLAAQIGVGPLSVYYFHQFPGLFFLTNIVVLPFLAILLFGGILVIVLASLHILPTSLALGYNWLVKLLNSFIAWVAQQELFVLDGLSVSFPILIAWYVTISFTALYLIKRQFEKLFFALVSIVCILGILIWENYTATNQELIVFQKTRKSIIGYKNGKELTIFNNDNLDVAQAFPVKDYLVGHRINQYSQQKCPKVFTYNKKKILLLDSTSVYLHKRVDAVILTYSTQINLDRLIDSLKPKWIVADGSNYVSYVKRWKETCKRKRISFHSTKEKGAFIFQK